MATVTVRNRRGESVEVETSAAAEAEKLRGEFDALVERMQTREAKAAGRALLAAPGCRLGHA